MIPWYGELFEGLGDGLVEAASEAFEHGADLLFDEGAEVIALDGVGDALVDKGLALGSSTSTRSPGWRPK